MKTILKRPGIRQTAALACALWLTAGCAATGAGTQENAFAPLVRGLADRLTTADQVALSKWDTGQSVYDPEREAKVIANVSGQAPAYGLTAEEVSSVFADQMEANKTVQYALLNGWRRDGAAPSAPRQSLRDVIRRGWTRCRLRSWRACAIPHRCAAPRIARRRPPSRRARWRGSGRSTRCIALHWTARRRVCASSADHKAIGRKRRPGMTRAAGTAFTTAGLAPSPQRPLRPQPGP